MNSLQDRTLDGGSNLPLPAHWNDKQRAHYEMLQDLRRWSPKLQPEELADCYRGERKPKWFRKNFLNTTAVRCNGHDAFPVLRHGDWVEAFPVRLEDVKAGMVVLAWQPQEWGLLSPPVPVLVVPSPDGLVLAWGRSLMDYQLLEDAEIAGVVVSLHVKQRGGPYTTLTMRDGTGLPFISLPEEEAKHLSKQEYDPNGLRA